MRAPALSPIEAAASTYDIHTLENQHGRYENLTILQTLAGRLSVGVRGTPRSKRASRVERLPRQGQLEVIDRALCLCAK
jgi:hypothetical protein